MELLIAATIFVLVAVAIYSAFRSGYNTYQRIEASFSVYQRARVFFNRIESELLNVYRYSEQDSRFLGTSQTLSFLSLIPEYDKDTGQRPALSQFDYSLQDGAVLRGQKSGLGVFLADDPVKKEAIISQISSLKFEYAAESEDKVSNMAYQWFALWPDEKKSEQLAGLPRAVKVELRLLPKKDSPAQDAITFTKVIALELGI